MEAINPLPGGVMYVTPESRIVMFKKIIKDGTNGFIEPFFIRDIIGTHTDGVVNPSAIIHAINNAGSVADLAAKLKETITNPGMLREIDGILTIKFNRYIKYFIRSLVTIDSFIADAPSIITEINTNGHNLEKILNPATITFMLYLKCSTSVFLSNGDIKDICINYDITDPQEDLAWMPFITQEAQFVFRDKDTIDSFMAYFKSKNTDPCNGTAWYEVIMNEFKSESAFNVFKNNRYAKVLLLDPYLHLKEYDVYLDINNRIIIADTPQ